MKNKKYEPTGFIVGVIKQGGGEAEYTVTGVKYLVDSRFLPPTTRTWENPTVKERLEDLIKSEFSPLTMARTNGTVLMETVCSAGQERSVL